MPFGLPAAFGGGAPAGGPLGSSASTSSTGAVNLGGLSFAPSNSDTIVTGLLVIGVILTAFVIAKGR